MNNIKNKLSDFIRKYYAFLLIRNIIYFLSLSLITILFFVITEFAFWTPSEQRKLFFYSILLISFFIGIYFLFLPFLSVWRYNKKIDRYTAAQMIGKFFPEINDKLYNYLQLSDMNDVSRETNQLLLKAIEQKERQLTLYHFNEALEKKSLYKILTIFFFFILFLTSVTVVNPSVTIEPLKRIIYYEQIFHKPQPFDFVLLNETLEGMQDENFMIQLRFDGDVIPQQAEIIIDNKKYRLKKVQTNLFTYEIARLKNDVQFHFEALGYRSDTYKIKVFKKPKIYKIQAQVRYPEYLNREAEVKENETDFIVPAGTKIYFTITAGNFDTIEEESQTINIYTQNNVVKFAMSVAKSNSYKFLFRTENRNLSDTLQLNFTAIPDMYPSIKIRGIADTLLFTVMYFRGTIEDDYGFTNLGFAYKKTTEQEFNVIPIPFVKNLTEQEFYFMFDFSQIDEWDKQEIEYYFFVSDNDEIKRYKTTKTQIFKFQMPGREEIAQMKERFRSEIQSNATQAIQLAQSIQKEAEQLRFDLLNKKSLTWEDQQRIQKLIQDKNLLEMMLQQLIESQENKYLFEEFMKNIPPELLEKQQQFMELLNMLMDEETQKLFEKFNELLQEMRKDKVTDYLQQMQIKAEELQKMLENNVQIMKQLEFEQRMNEVVEQLQQMAEQLEQLSKQLQDQKFNPDLLIKHQQIKNEYDQVQKELQKLKEMNEELSSPIDFPEEINELDKNVQQQLNQAQENLSKGKNSRASEHQRKASEMMKQMADSLEKAMSQAEQENLAEDIENLKRILKNLVILSIQQEQNMKFANNINTRDPSYTRYMAEQKRIERRYQMVQDSLMALAKRQVAVQSIIQKHLSTIRDHFSKVNEYMNIGAIQAAQTNQQYVMKSLNDLALLLLEALDQMNQQMMQQMSGQCGKNSQCRNAKPGSKPGDKPSIRTMKQLQEQLNKQMEEYLKQMQQGRGKDGQQMSESLMRMAIQQEMIRKMMEDYARMLQSEGLRREAQMLQQIMQQMEQTERELVNKQLSQNTILRQRDIMVRLMESEKAELEREHDNKRTSKTGKIFNNRNPEEIFQYKKEKNETIDVMKVSPIMYSNYYRQRIARFYKNLSQ